MLSRPNKLSLRIPEPSARPGEKPDFSAMKIPDAGAVRRPPADVEPGEIRDLAWDLIRVLDFEGNAVGPWDPKLDPEIQRRALKLMVFDRLFEDRMFQAQRQGKTTFFMRALGEEAISVANGLVLNPDDMCFTSYRQQGILLARGCPVLDMMNQVYNNAGDKQEGIQMGMHYSFPDYGYFAMSGNVATQIPQAVGWAMGSAYRGDTKIAVGFIGDGSTAEGDFHAALLFAQVYRAPAIIAVSNNQWAISTFQGIAGGMDATFAARGVGVGLPSLRVDGNDFLAVYAAVQWAAERARTNNGATLIEFLTYRGHAHSTSDDPSRYRPQDEFAAWPLGDPIARLKLHLIKSGKWSEEQHAAYEKEASEEIRTLQRQAEAVGTMGKGEGHSPKVIFDHVFEEPDWRHLRQRRDMGY